MYKKRKNTYHGQSRYDWLTSGETFYKWLMRQKYDDRIKTNFIADTKRYRSFPRGHADYDLIRANLVMIGAEPPYLAAFDELFDEYEHNRYGLTKDVFNYNRFLED